MSPGCSRPSPCWRPCSWWCVSTPRGSRAPLTLDALLGAVTAAAIFFAVLVGTLDRLTQPGTPTDVVVTNLAYPLLDVTILVVMVGLVAVTHGRLPWSVVAMCVGLLVFAAVDTAFLYQVTAGTFRPGSILTPLSLAGTMLIALAAWLPDRARPRPPLTRRNLLAPVAPDLLCVIDLGVRRGRTRPRDRGAARVGRSRDRDHSDRPHVHRRPARSERNARPQ